MKYRLYGRDGINDKEFNKLKDFVDPASGDKQELVVKRRPDYDYKLSLMEQRDAKRR